MRLLYLSHNHPQFSLGGAQIYAVNLHRQINQARDHISYLVCSREQFHKPGRMRGEFYNLPYFNEVFFMTSTRYVDTFDLMCMEPFPDLYNLINTFEPDVIHFQHILGFGVNLVTEIKRLFPHIKCFLTLHDYALLCNNHGTLFRTDGNLCTSISSIACFNCLPMYSITDYEKRKLDLLSHLVNFNAVICPSKFLQSKLATWSNSAINIIHIKNAVMSTPRKRGELARRRGMTHLEIGFIGQLSPLKGILTLLRACLILNEDPQCRDKFTLRCYGANQNHLNTPFDRELQVAFAKCAGFVVACELVDHESIASKYSALDVIVVPSIWYENSPLVIQEALQSGVPVVCSDIGGMAEFVNHQVNGLHFVTGNSLSLASQLKSLILNKDLLERLTCSSSVSYSFTDHVQELITLYKG